MFNQKAEILLKIKKTQTMFLSDSTAVYTLSKFKKKNVFHINITLYISDIKSFSYIIAVNFCGTPLISKLKMLYFFSKIMRTVQNCCIIIIQRFFFPGWYTYNPFLASSSFFLLQWLVFLQNMIFLLIQMNVIWHTWSYYLTTDWLLGWKI